MHLLQLLKRLRLKTVWLILAGLLPGVVIGLVIAIVGLITLAPAANLPPIVQDNSPGDVTVQLSQSFLDAMTRQHVNGTTLPPPFESAQIEDAQAYLVPGDQLIITGQIMSVLPDSSKVIVDLQPCVTSAGRPSFGVTRVMIGSMNATSTAGPMIQQRLNDSLKGVNPTIPGEHLSRMQTTQNELILIYTSGGGSGQPACQTS